MEIGVSLTENDIQAVKKLFSLRWSASIRNWKEREVGGCLWMVSCPDMKGSWLTVTNPSLSEAINSLLKQIIIRD